MRDARQITLVAVFFLIIFGVPVTQAVRDIAIDEMAPQALDLFHLPEVDADLPLLGRVGQQISNIMDGERLRRFEEALQANSIVEEHGRRWLQWFRYLVLRDLGEKATRGRDTGYFYTPDVRYLAEPYFRDPRSASSGRDDPVEVIADFRRQLASMQIDLVVVPVPGKASIYPDELLGSVEPTSEVWSNTARLAAELVLRGVDVLDLHAVFAARRLDPERPERLYMLTDTHWTGHGVDLAARALANKLRQGGWAPAPPADVRYVRETVRVHRRGDVLEMTQIPGRESFFADEVVDVYQVFEADGSLYQDSSISPILILGDSFSRVFQTDAPRSAGLIANTAFYLQTPLSSLVNDGGASTLVREQLARRLELLEGRSVVVWEFVERDVRFGMKGWQPIALAPGNGQRASSRE